MYSEKDSKDKISVVGLSTEQATVLQIVALAAAENRSLPEAHRNFMRRLAMDIDKQLPYEPNY